MISVFLNILLVQGQFFTNYSQTNQQTVLRTQSQNVSITSYNQEAWFAQIGIGYPTQYFNVQVDTGSNILWVAQSNCRNCEMKTRYNPSGQALYQPNGSVYTQYYGSGECSGYVATDAVSLTGSIVNQTFAMMFATYESGFAFSDEYSGIMGLSNNQTFQNLFQDAFSNGQIATEIYGLVLNPIPLTSYLIFGDIDPQILSTAVWVTPDDIYRWKFFVNNFIVNGVDYSSAMGATTSGILDSGTSCMVVTAELFEIIYDNYLYPAGCIYDDGVYCPCWNANNASYPNITLVLNQVTINVPYQNLFLDFYESDPGQYCQVCLSYEDGTPFMVFGDPVLQSIVPIFNKTANQVGFIGGIQNNIPNPDYPGNDEIDEDYIQ